MAMNVDEARAMTTLSGRLAKIREETKETMQKATLALSSGAAGFGLGYYAGRYPDKTQMLGVDMELVVAAVGLGASLIPSAAKSLGPSGAAVAEGIGNGALAVYLFKSGKKQGEDAKSTADKG